MEVRSFSGQFGHVRALVFLLRRPRQDLELRHRRGTLADRRADAVRTGIATADHHHFTAGGENRPVIVPGRAGDAGVLLGEEIHGEVDAVQFAPRHRQIAGLLGAAGEDHRIAFAEQPGDRDARPHMAVRAELHPFRLHLRHPLVDPVLLHLEVGNAVAEQAADPVALFVDDDGVAGTGELLGAGEAGRPGSHHGHPLAGAVPPGSAAGPSPLPSPCR